MRNKKTTSAPAPSLEARLGQVQARQAIALSLFEEAAKALDDAAEVQAEIADEAQAEIDRLARLQASALGEAAKATKAAGNVRALFA